MSVSRVYILALNEETNIGKCLRRLSRFRIPVTLLDSGSSDRTLEIARTFPFCTIEPYRFSGHAHAYNEITSKRTPSTEFVMVLDADMEVSEELYREVVEICTTKDTEVVRAPVQMYVEGFPLRFGSLYPPKAFVFRGGAEYFLAAGHSDRLRPNVKVATTKSKLIHNDLKDYSVYLLTQCRYGQNLWENYLQGAVSLKDRIRVRTVWGSVLMMLYSYFIRGGFLAGKLGLLYAIDRLIAGLIQFRIATANRMKLHPKHSDQLGNR
ncbi:MAG: glycosyltransferase [Candidatus Hadarchaeum sp.]